MFDAYHKWLGIPKEQQPPTFYQLLGITPTERDPEVIEEAAIRQTAHIRTYQTGPQAQECIKLLNEIAQARATLLNPAKRAAYDARLANQAAAAPMVQGGVLASASAPDIFANLTGTEADAPATYRGTAPRAKAARSMWPWMIGTGVAAAAVLVAVIFYLTRPPRPSITKGPDPDQKSVDHDKSESSPKFTVLPTDLVVAPGETRTLTVTIDRDGAAGAIKTTLDHQLKWLKAAPAGTTENSERPDWELTIAPDAPEGEATVRVRAQVGSQSARGQDEIKLVVHRKLAGERQIFRGHTQAVWAVALSPNGKQALSAGEDKVVRIWDVASGTVTTVLKGHTDRVEAAAFSPDSRFVLTGGADRSVRLWDLQSPGEAAHEFKGHTDTVTWLAFSADGRLAASGGLDKVVRVWDIASRKALETSLPTSTQQISSVDLAPDGNTILYARNDRLLRLWDRAMNQERDLPTGHSGEVRVARFLPNGRYAASGGMDGTVRITEVATGLELRLFRTENNDRVWDVAPSPNGRYLLAAGQSGALYLWDVVTRRRVQLTRDNARVLKVAYAADGRSALSGNESGIVRLWDLPAAPTGSVVLLPEKRGDTAKQRVPPSKAQDAARQALKQEFAADYEAAVRRVDKRRELARKLLQKAQETKANTAPHFVLLSEARDQATAGGAVKTAAEAIGQLVEHYAEASALEMWLKVLEATIELREFSGIEFRAAAEQALILAEETIQGDDYPNAAHLLKLGERLARLATAKELLAGALSRAKVVESLTKDYEQIKTAVEALKRDPGDPVANTAVGKFRCLAKDDWEKGLPLLARGSDEALKKLAQQDLAGATAAPEQVALGNEWWARAQQDSEYAGAKTRLEERARRWYWRAFRNLSAEEKKKLLPRLSVTIDKVTYQPGLRAELFNLVGAGLNRVPQLRHTRIDHEIDFNWGAGSPHQSVTPDNFAVIWRGYLIAPKAGEYTFILRADDSARLTIDSKPLAGHLNRGNNMEERATLRLSTRPRAIMVEHHQGFGGSYVHLLWIPPGETQPQPVPTEVLYHAPK